MPDELIDSDIRRAQTLPADFYRDMARFRAQQDRLFPQTWHFAADTWQWEHPDQLVPLTLLPGGLDEPLLLRRDESGVFRCLSNVCTHRGNLLLRQPCRAKAIQCRYHGRRFNLDGTLAFMPEFQETENFPAPQDHLPRVPLGQWGPFLFVSLEPAVAFAELIGPLQERLAWVPFERFTFDPSRSREYLVEANWALYCDNYLEGFHIPYVHPQLAKVLDYRSYRTELLPYGVLQLGLAGGPGEAVFAIPPGHPDHGQPVAAYYYWLFPGTMFNLYPWGLSVNVVQPLAPDRTRVLFLSYLWQPELLDQGAGGDLDRVEQEDESVVEGVQQGIRSRLYQRGRYSPAQERGVHHFHRLLSAFPGL